MDNFHNSEAERISHILGKKPTQSWSTTGGSDTHQDQHSHWEGDTPNDIHPKLQRMGYKQFGKTNQFTLKTASGRGEHSIELNHEPTMTDGSGSSEVEKGIKLTSTRHVSKHFESMEPEMNEEIEQDPNNARSMTGIVDFALDNDAQKFIDKIREAIGGKVVERINSMKVQVAKGLFGGQPEQELTPAETM